MRWRAIPGLLCCLLVLGPAAAAEPEATFKPTAVMQLRPLEDLIGDFRYLVKQLDREEEAKQIEGLLKSRTGPKGLEGIDTKKPLGVYGILNSQLDQSQVVVLVPMADEKTFLDFLDSLNLKPEKSKDGLYTLKVENVRFPLLFRFAHGYLYATARFNDKATLPGADSLPRPSTVLGGNNSLASLTVNIDAIPGQMRKLAISSSALQLGGLKEQELPNGTEKQKALRDATVDEVSAQLRSLLEDGTAVRVQIDLDQKTHDLGMTFSLAGKPGSTLAKNIASLSAGKSLAAGLLDRTSAMGGLAHLGLPERVQKALEPAVDELITKALNDADANARELITPLAKALAPTARAGKLDVMADMRGPGKGGKYTFVAGVQLEKGQAVEKAFRDLIGNLPADAVGKLRLDVAKAGPVSIHKVNQELNEQTTELFGDTPLYFAIREDALLLAFGEESLEAIKGAAKALPSAAKPLRLELSLGRIAKLMTKQHKEAPAAAQKAFTGKDSDKVVLEVQADDRLQVRLRVKTPVLTFANLLDQARKKKDE